MEERNSNFVQPLNKEYALRGDVFQGLFLLYTHYFYNRGDYSSQYKRIVFLINIGPILTLEE